MKPKIVILITSAGSRAAEAIISCLDGVRDQIRLVGTNSVAAFLSIIDLDASYLVPPSADAAAFGARLREIIALEQPDIVINGRDEEVAMLALLAVQTGRAFLGPPPALAEIFVDKYQTWRYCVQRGLPFARTASTQAQLDALIGAHGFPLIAKPRRGGHASKDVYFVHQRQQALALLDGGNVIFQPVLDGAPDGGVSVAPASHGVPYAWNPSGTHYLLDFVIGAAGTLVSACVTRAEGAGSIFQRLELVDDPALLALLEQHAQVLARDGHRGPVNVQGCIGTNGQFCAFEWNARFVGSVDGFALLGKNLVLDALIERFPQCLSASQAAPTQAMLFRPQRYRAVPLEAINALTQYGCYSTQSRAARIVGSSG